MQLARMAEITKVFAEEGLGFLIEARGARRASTRERNALGAGSVGAADAVESMSEGEPEAGLAGDGDGEDDAAEDRPEAGDELAKRGLSDTEVAARLRRTLERLGPTFVKFGQMLSTRVDLFSEEFLAELGKLHSEVAPFPTEEAKRLVEAELGSRIDEVFEAFPDAPIASASIAQVYKARMRQRAEGDEGWVAIKVQRPNLDETLLRDLDALISFSSVIDKLVPRYRRSMVHKVAQEYAHRARGELDFMGEAQAIERFSDVLRSLPEFRVPRVHHAMCTPRLLVMEWLEGAQLDGVRDGDALRDLGFEPETFARSMLRLQLSMSYEHGFVHGDTHPGNVILLPGGHVGLIDFGLHAHVPRTLRDKMLEMLFYQSSGRHDEAIEAFVTVFKPDPNSDIDAFKKQMRALMEADAGPHSLSDGRITEQLIQGMRIGSKYRLEAQSGLLMVLRNLAIVEGIVLRYCPTIDPNEEVRTIVGQIMRRKLFGPSMRDEVTALVPQVLLTLSQRPRLAERFLRLERNFVASRNLGEFLRQEEVRIADKARSATTWTHLLAALVGTGVGAALHAL